MTTRLGLTEQIQPMTCLLVSSDGRDSCLRLVFSHWQLQLLVREVAMHRSMSRTARLLPLRPSSPVRRESAELS